MGNFASRPKGRLAFLRGLSQSPLVAAALPRRLHPKTTTRPWLGGFLGEVGQVFVIGLGARPFASRGRSGGLASVAGRRGRTRGSAPTGMLDLPGVSRGARRRAPRAPSRAEGESSFVGESVAALPRRRGGFAKAPSGVSRGARRRAIAFCDSGCAPGTTGADPTERGHPAQRPEPKASSSHWGEATAACRGGRGGFAKAPWRKLRIRRGFAATERGLCESPLNPAARRSPPGRSGR